MPRLIDADVLKAHFAWWKNDDMKEIFNTIVELQPAVDAVPVVRCRDCLLQRGCKSAQYLGDDGYCSHGERKGGGK